MRAAPEQAPYQHDNNDIQGVVMAAVAAVACDDDRRTRHLAAANLLISRHSANAASEATQHTGRMLHRGSLAMRNRSERRQRTS